MKKLSYITVLILLLIKWFYYTLRLVIELQLFRSFKIFVIEIYTIEHGTLGRSVSIQRLSLQNMHHVSSNFGMYHGAHASGYQSIS